MIDNFVSVVEASLQAQGIFTIGTEGCNLHNVRLNRGHDV